MKTSLDQTGFSALEALLIIVIVGLIAGVGYFVVQSNQKANTTLSAPSSTTQTSVSKAASVIALDKSQLASGWKAVVDTPSDISLADTASKCTAFVSQTASPSLAPSGAQAFVTRKLAALNQGNAQGDTATVGTTTSQMISSQTVSMYPVTLKEKNQVTGYEKVGYVVGKGYYVSVIENCTNQTNLTQADQALQAVTIKS